MGTDSDQNKLIARILILIAVVADWSAVTAIFAKIVNQDPLLIFLMTIAAIVIGGVGYLLISKFRIGIRGGLITFIVSLVLTIVAWSLLASSEVTPLKVNITDPQDGRSVTRLYLAKGTVSDPNSKVYVIVRTLRMSQLWVQQPPIVDGGGNWQASVYFGNEMISSDERYEVIALATTDNFLVTWATGNLLSEGQELLSLPRKSNKSGLITVTRPK